MEKLQIFEGLNLPMEAIREVCMYWKYAGYDVGVIDVSGNMRTSETIWTRPCASGNYKTLRTALEETSRVKWITLKEDRIVIDFSQIRYNFEWVKKMLAIQKVGVCDSGDGLKIYEKVKTTSGKEWYIDLPWQLKDVTVNQLELKKSKVVSLTPNTSDPDDAEWAKLYFVE